jgi:hypothetical protein
MSSIQVQVFRGQEFVVQKDRPVRQLPDGRYGVVFQGVVYPLQPGSRIQLDGTSLDPAMCPVLRENPPDLYADFADADWLYLDNSGYYPYLMMDGDEDILDAVVHALEGLSIEVLSWGLSRRPADNGRQYHWYIRLDPDFDPNLDGLDLTRFDGRVVYAARAAGRRRSSYRTGLM